MPVQYTETVNEQIRLDILSSKAYSLREIADRNLVGESYVQKIKKGMPKESQAFWKANRRRKDKRVS